VLGRGDKTVNSIDKNGIKTMVQDTDEILIVFAERGGSVADWIGQHPQHAEEIAQFAAGEWAETHAPLKEDAAKTARLEARMLQNMRAIRAKQAAAKPALASLTEAAQAAGLSVKEAAARLGLGGVASFAKLDQRLIAPQSVPQPFVQMLAQILQRTADDVAAYLALPPRLSSAASYRSNTAPSAGKQETFAEALKRDDAARRLWLNEGVNEEEGA
jgi:hypothetical protein